MSHHVGVRLQDCIMQGRKLFVKRIWVRAIARPCPRPKITSAVSPPGVCALTLAPHTASAAMVFVFPALAAGVVIAIHSHLPQPGPSTLQHHLLVQRCAVRWCYCCPARLLAHQRCRQAMLPFRAATMSAVLESYDEIGVQCQRVDRRR